MQRTTTLGALARRESRLLAWLGVCAAIVTLGKTVADSEALVVAGAALALVGALGRAVIAWHRADLEAAREEAGLARRLRAPVGRVAEIAPTDVGVDPAVQDILEGGNFPTYIDRKVDASVRAALDSAFNGTGPWLVVVLGVSKVGKSRSLFQALLECGRSGELDLVAPVDAGALQSILTPGETLQLKQGSRSVLWLDDLEPFLNDGVTWATLREWHSRYGPSTAVAATYGGKGSDIFEPHRGAALASVAGDVLQHAAEIRLGAASDDELQPLTAHLPDLIVKSIQRHGLAAYLVAAPILERKLSTQRQSIGDSPSPEGVAAVYAAVDWARTGRTDPIPRADLRELWTHYLLPGSPTSDSAFEAGLEWALLPVAGSIALLSGVEEFRPYDYIARFLGEQPDAAPPRLEAWSIASETARDGQALSVAEAAYFARRLQIAERAVTRATESQIPEIAAMGLFNLGVLFADLNRWEEELSVYDDVVERFGGAAEPALRKQVAKALLNKGVALGQLDRSEEELDVCDELVARYGEAEESDLREQVAHALFNTGVTFGRLGRSENELDVYDDVIDRFGGAEEPVLREHVARALVNKGVLLGRLDRLQEALAVFQDVVDRFGEAKESVLREQVAKALFSKAVTLHLLGRSEEEPDIYDDIVERFGENDEPALREQVAKALVNKGILLGQLGRMEEALAVFEDVVERFGEAEELVLREQIANALFSKGVTFHLLGRLEEEASIFDNVVERFGEAEEPTLREQVAKALVNKGLTLGQLGRLAEEPDVYDDVVERFSGAEEPALNKHVAKALVNKGVALGQLGRLEEALAVFQDVVDRFGEAEESDLREQVAMALINKGVTFGRLGRSQEEVDAYDAVVQRFGGADEPALRAQVAKAKLAADHVEFAEPGAGDA